MAFCALLNLALIWLQDMEVHAHMIVGGILGPVIFLIAMLDNPFRGGAGLPFELEFNQLDYSCE